MRRILAALAALLIALPAAADVTWRVVPFAALTGAGNQDKTHADLGGQTPDGAFVWLSGATVAGTVAAKARHSFGATDGTDSIYITNTCEDGLSTTDCDSMQGTGSVGTILTPSRTLMCPMTATLIAGGVNLAQTAGCDAAYLGSVVLISGSAPKFNVVRFNSPNSLGATVDVNTVGFEPEIVLMVKNRMTSFSTTAVGSMTVQYGLSKNGPLDTTMSVAHVLQNGLTTSDVAGRVQNDRMFTHDTKEPDGSLINESYDGSGFSARNEDVANSEEFAAIAMSFNGEVPIYLEVVDTPAGANAGAHAFSGPAFLPQFSWWMMTGIGAANTVSWDVTASTDPTTLGMGFYDGTQAWSMSTSGQENAASAAFKSLVSTTDLKMLSNAGTVAWTGAPSHVASGSSINFSLNPAARKWVYLAIGQTAGIRRRTPWGGVQ